MFKLAVLAVAAVAAYVGLNGHGAAAGTSPATSVTQHREGAAGDTASHHGNRRPASGLAGQHQTATFTVDLTALQRDVARVAHTVADQNWSTAFAIGHN